MREDLTRKLCFDHVFLRGRIFENSTPFRDQNPPPLRKNKSLLPNLLVATMDVDLLKFIWIALQADTVALARSANAMFQRADNGDQ